MTLIELVVTLVIVGLVLWAIQAVIPMDAKVKAILQVVVIVFLALWLLQGFGLLHGGPALRLR